MITILGISKKNKTAKANAEAVFLTQIDKSL